MRHAVFLLLITSVVCRAGGMPLHTSSTHNRSQHILVNLHYLDIAGESLSVRRACAASFPCLTQVIGSSGAVLKIKDNWGDIVVVTDSSLLEHFISETHGAIDLLVEKSADEFALAEQDFLFTYEERLRVSEGAKNGKEERGVQDLALTRIPRFDPPERHVPRRWSSAVSCENPSERRPKSRVLVGIVIDARVVKYQVQAMTLVRSIYLFGGELAKADVLAVVVGDLPEVIAEEMRDLGVKLKPALPITDVLKRATPHCNKLRFFLTEEAKDIDAYDKVLYLDTDTFVLSDPIKYLEKADNYVVFRTGKTLWSDAVFGFKIWEQLCELCGASPDLNSTIGWPNTGVIAMPTWRVPLVTFEWLHYIDFLAAQIPNEDHYFLDTLAFIFALEAVSRVYDGGRVERGVWRLPWELNVQLNWGKYDMIRNGWISEEISQHVPVLLQYAQDSIGFDREGHLKLYENRTVEAFPFLSSVNQRIADFNIALEQLSTTVDSTQ